LKCLGEEVILFLFLFVIWMHIIPENIALSVVATKRLYHSWYRVHSVFSEFVMNLNIVVSFHHTVAMKHCLEDDEIERQLKCKNCDQRWDSVRWQGGRSEALYIHQADNNKKVYTLNFTIFQNNYLQLCKCFY
jgi:hypothetical protein